MSGRPEASTSITADLIIELDSGAIVLVKRRYPPIGWALPGGFLEPGESLETCARREALEETGLEVELLAQLHAYSEPGRDPRGHTVTVVFHGRASGIPQGGDDAAVAQAFPLDRLPTPLVFDHARILADFIAGRHPARPWDGVSDRPESSSA